MPKTVLLLLPEAVSRMLLLRMALWFLPYGRLIQFCGLEHVAEPPCHDENCVELAAVRRAVDIAARRLVPFSTCLCRALTAHGILHRKGYRPSLAIALMTSSNELAAHAWLQLGTRLVTERNGYQAARMVVWFR